jgi:hypothetical protein
MPALCGGDPAEEGIVTRSILRSAEWTLGLDLPPVGIYSAECLTCGAQAQPTDNARMPVEVWAIRHTGLNPTHRQFKATAETLWRVTPTGDNPYRESDAQGE